MCIVLQRLRENIITMTPESKHFMAGLLMAAVLIAGIAVELVLLARWFKWPY